MIRSRCAMVSLSLLLTACDGGAADPPAPNGNTAAGDRALVAKIGALAPGHLNLVLFRAIRDAGHACQGIAASRRIADQGGRPAWSAQCERGDRFLLVLSPAGLMNVTPGAAFGQP